jgi:nucleoside-diphosphate-sugar epimerase
VRYVTGMANLGSVDTEATAARVLTEELLRSRRRRGKALAHFKDVRQRGIPGFEDAVPPLPDKIVVTGGTGCVGTSVLGLLGSLGVTGLTSFSRRPPAADRRHAGVSYRKVDIRDPAALRAAFCDEEPGLVIHLAGQRQPGLAERRVAETISSNVVGTMSVLATAGATGVPRVVTASTGKALRFFASEVYAATKKLAEYLVAQGPERWGVSTATTRFTHIVDNSVAYQRFRGWARSGAPIRLHAPDIAFYAQSAREAAQLLVSTASTPDQPEPVLTVLADIGWPHDLLDLALDVIEEAGSRSFLLFPGYEPGYMDQMYPGTFDPRRVDCSPLLNVVEVGRLTSSPHQLDQIQRVELVPTSERRVDAAICDLEAAWRNGLPSPDLRAQLNVASVALLKKTVDDASTRDVETILSLARGKVGHAEEHRIVHRQLKTKAKALGVGQRLAS